MKVMGAFDNQITTATVLSGDDVPSSPGHPSGAAGLWPSVVIGELVGIKDDGRTPLVMFAGQQGSAAVAARSIVDLHSVHIGKPVVLVFEGGGVMKAIVAGVVRDGCESTPESRPGHVEVDVDGERMMIAAKEQLVMRCGKASITLTKAGKVLIDGSYVSTRSTGVNRIKGASVQIN